MYCSLEKTKYGNQIALKKHTHSGIYSNFHLIALLKYEISIVYDYIDRCYSFSGNQNYCNKTLIK